METGTKQDALIKSVDYPISVKRIKDVTEYLDTKVVHEMWQVMFEDAKHTRKFTDIPWGILRIIVRLYHKTKGLMAAGKIHEIIKKHYMEVPKNKKGANVGGKASRGLYVSAQQRLALANKQSLNSAMLNINSILAEYKEHIDKDYKDSIAYFKNDKSMLEMFKKDKADHYSVMEYMKDGSWNGAYKKWAGMDTASREEITNVAYELLMKKNGYSTYKKGGYVFKGDKYEYQTIKSEYTVGGL